MKILQVHNFYRRAGGEDQVYEAEYDLLTKHGHKVERYSAQNQAIETMSGLGIGLRTVFNRESYREIRNAIARERPDVVHAHNTFPIVSPALYYAAASEGVPVIQTLHNYRLLCPAATLFRDGAICEECVGSKVPYSAVAHRCYRKSAFASAAVASMLAAHWMAGTWTTKIHTYIALTNFTREKFIEGGFPAGKIVVKPNFLARDPGIGKGNGNYALFAGRLSEEKGLRTLLNAWERLARTIALKIAGDGPLADFVRQRADLLPNVEWLGDVEHARVMELMKNAAFLVVPSAWQEPFGMVIIEAAACGTPVIGSAVGSMTELIQNGVNGLHFTADDVNGLVDRVQAILTRPDDLLAMRQSSRLCYERNYTAERNYALLMQIYQSAASTTASAES